MEFENIFNLSADVKICTNNPKREFRSFKKKFNFIEAAGGIVEYQNSFLFIERLGKWDLPKGKIDNGETPKEAALREIEEECNINGHRIHKKLCNTYHTYEWHGEQVLKKTYWYYLKVKSLDLASLRPQHEEGITALRWFTLEEFNQVRENTFASIHEVLNTFLKVKNVD